MTAMTTLLLKASLLLLIAFVARRVLRAAPAAQRHGVWSAAFVGLLALPLLVVALPPLDVPVLSSVDDNAVRDDNSRPLADHNSRPLADYNSRPLASLGETTPDQAETGPIVPGAYVAPSEARGLQWQFPSLRTSLIGAWLLGVAAALAALFVSFARVRKLEATGVELTDDRWRDALARVASRLGYGEAVRVIACDGIRTPMAGGLLRATVFVPLDADGWDDQRREMVLAHEIAHLANRDPLRNLVSRIACTLYWFHPLVWLALRDSAADCEQACDERVLSLGVRPSAYADLLLDFAAGPILNPKVAVPMVRRARLEQRLMSILENRPRPTVRRTLAPALVAGALTLSLAAARPVARVEPVAASEPVAVAPVKVVAPEAAAPAPVAPRTIAKVAAVVPEPAPVVYAVAPACWGAEDRSGSFSGSMSTSSGTIHEQIGRRGSERVIQSTYGNLRVCMITEGFDGDREDRPSQWPLRSERVILETRMPNDVRTLDIDNGRHTFTVNGAVQPLEGAAEWRNSLVGLLDAAWELSQLRGRVSSMRGEISSIYGERSSLQGQISSLRGHVSSLRGEISSIRGHESSLRGQISSIKGHESSLRGQISSERGAISSLRGMSWERARDIDVEARIRRHEENIRRIEQEIRDYDTEGRVRDVERQLQMYDTEGRVAEVERRIREFDVERKVEAVQRQLDRLEVDSRVNVIEGEIRGLEVSARTRDLEERRDEALARVRRTLGR